MMIDEDRPRVYFTTTTDQMKSLEEEKAKLNELDYLINLMLKL